MSIYVDTSAPLKRYLEEPDSDAAEAFLAGDLAWFSGRHTYVEVRLAADIGEQTELRSLDSLHIGAARLGPDVVSSLHRSFHPRG